jgi:hypothetical protein
MNCAAAGPPETSAMSKTSPQTAIRERAGLSAVCFVMAFDPWLTVLREHTRGQSDQKGRRGPSRPAARIHRCREVDRAPLADGQFPVGIGKSKPSFCSRSRSHWKRS